MEQNEMYLRDIESEMVDERLSTLLAQNEMRDMESAIVRSVEEIVRSVERLSTLAAQNEMRDMESAIVRSVEEIVRSVKRLSTLPAQNEMRDMESATVRSVEERFSTFPAQNELRDMESAIVRSVQERLLTLPDQHVAATIFKVPHIITSGQPKAYKPIFVSIGPFHHNRNFPDGHQTKAAETHKIWYLRDFLGRNGQPCEFKDYVRGILLLEGKARNCYSEEVQLTRQELVESMVLDACFIIELFLKDKEHSIDKDPIYGSWLIQYIGYDLLLLENQLPFFILEDVYKRFNKEKMPLTELAMNFLGDFLHFRRKDAKLPAESVEVHHLLHLVYLLFEFGQPLCTSKLNFLCEWNFFPFQQRSKSSNEAQQPTHQVTIPSATQLHDAGVKFSKSKNTNFLAIEINNGRLEIPPFFLDDSSDFFMRNLIAFEQCFPQTNRENVFTLYAYFMDRLVNTEKDVEILSKIGIIEHALGSDEEAAGFFNKLCNGLVVNLEKTHLGEICKQLNKYYRFRRHMWWANLMHDYFSSPWTILSLVAGLVLLVLTFIQTMFSVMSYVKPK